MLPKYPIFCAFFGDLSALANFIYSNYLVDRFDKH
jgi:hypothetical protein